MKAKKIKPVIKTNKLNNNPLFIKFLNWQRDKYTIDFLLKGIEDSFNSKEDKSIVSNFIKKLDDTYLLNLEQFQKQFIIFIQSVITTQNVSETFLTWMSNYFKYLKEEVIVENKEEKREIKIVDSEGNWFEAIICYNFIMAFNGFGVEIIKKCPICSKFFCHKGKYAKYCSEKCKETGMKK